MSASAGRVLLMPKGVYDSNETYHYLDTAYYDGSTYVCKKTSIGNLPTDTEYWQILAQGTSDTMPGSYYGTCVTVGSVADKNVTVPDVENFGLKIGDLLSVTFSNTNTATSPTINVNSSGAKPVMFDTKVISDKNIDRAGVANRLIQYVYDGSSWVFVGWSYDVGEEISNMIFNNHFTAEIEDEAENVITDESGNLILGDFKFQIA